MPESAAVVRDERIGWLLDGDVAIQYPVWRDLLDQDQPDLQAWIATEGRGARLLAARRTDGAG